MKTLWTLYVKEWKDTRNGFAFLMIALALVGIYGSVYFEPDILSVGPRAILSYIPFVLGVASCFMAPPVLLARSFSSEWKSDTHYQLFSLPIPKFLPALAKYCTVVSQGFLMFLLMGGFVFGVGVTHWGSDDTPRLAYDDVITMMVFGFLAYLIMMLGFVTAMEGVKFTVKRFQRLVSVAFFFVALYFYVWFYWQIVGILDFFGTFQIDTVMNGQDVMVVGEIALAIFFYPALVGVLFLVFGLALFEKYVEI
jgi:hypothetical protein